MGKAPSFQFYVKDWLSDPQLRLTSPSTRGIWIDLLCFMWDAPERGKIDSTVGKLSRLVGSTNVEFDLFISEAQELKFCDVICYDVTDRNKKIRICNRRMWREDNDRKNNRLRQQRHREKQKNNKQITPPSPSPSPSAVKKEYENEAESDECPFPRPQKKDAAFSRLNSKNNSNNKVTEYIKTACEILYDQRDFKKVNTLCNTLRKKKLNNKTIAHILKRCIDSNKSGDLWGYCLHIAEIEDGNINESDFLADEKNKNKKRPKSLKAIFKEAQN